ncbi:hypothetical protein HN51_052958 [Arachis hypogaea]|uniref:Cytochrome P450 n=1 Tax=Arachis hypogaea TaxID=3818 RepID=A0A445C8J9_ARAHY|nr:cytochrome P450 711A1 [Arachis ipaensis]XP_025666641.1 cytochrome P450 711A1 [Arachis hypogaea]QHN94373.1 Cytochrome P450 [Arachis hypogaea]RYR47286.1 hypothetical protein Ahy_A07g033233 [Arachis hypogaea]
MDLEWLFPIDSNSSSLTAILFTVVAIMGGLLAYLYGPYWKVRQVPGPPTWPLVGHLHLMAKYGPDLFTLLAKQYGPIYRFHMGRQPLIIIADPELCREVGTRKAKEIPNRSMPSPVSAAPIHQRGLFFTKGEQWSTMRSTVTSFFHTSFISSMVPTMQSFIEPATQILDSHAEAQEDINFSNFSLRLATDVVGQASFGVNFGLSKPHSTKNDAEDGEDEVSQFINQHIFNTTHLKMDLSGSLSIIIGLILPILQEPCRQILKRIPGTMDWKIERGNRSLSGRIDRIIEKRMEEKGRSSKDFLSIVLSGRERKQNYLTPDYISALTYEQLLAGSTTTSFTMSSIVYLVAGHPHVEKKLLQEIDAFGPKDKIPTPQDLKEKFPYLDQVINESMRYYMASPLIAREASTDVEIGGYLLPKGTWVWLALGALSKDPKSFPEPEKFKPERFDPNCEEMKRRHPYAFIPFGIGPRICIGKQYAQQEVKLTLIHLYRRYVFRHSPDMEIPLELDYGLVLNFKNGVKVRVVKRNID